MPDAMTGSTELVNEVRRLTAAVEGLTLVLELLADRLGAPINARLAPPVAPEASDLAQDAASSPPPAKRPWKRVWTDARRELLLRHYPAGMQAEDIMDLVNALPGPSITDRHRISVEAGRLGLSRPPGFVPSRQPSAPTCAVLQVGGVAAVVAAVEDSAPAAPRFRAANLMQISDWAAQRGITVDGPDDVGRANRKRVELGLPQFQLVNAFGPV